MKERFFPEKIYIEHAVINFSMSRKILSLLKDVPFEVINDVKGLQEDFLLNDDPFRTGKRTILLTRQKGPFIKSCPCTPEYVGCRYQIINTDLNCPYDCSYCILQQYLSHPLLSIQVNTDDLWDQLDGFITNVRRPVRIGTGELGDSLVLDHITERSRDLIEFIRNRKKAVLELKTKSVNIENLLQTDPPENVVIAWSINSEKMAVSEEHGAPDVGARLQAARTVADHGYRIGFHFDPLIHYPGWEDGYLELVESLLSKFDPRRVAWISLGSLRFPHALKSVIRKRFPESRILYEELIKGKDGKLRYFKPLRLKMYNKVLEAFKPWKRSLPAFYFCMESEEVWEKALKIKPRGEEEVEKLLCPPSR